MWIYRFVRSRNLILELLQGDGKRLGRKRCRAAEEFTAIERLECIVEGVVPCVDAHADVDVAEVKPDYTKQQSPGRPFLFGGPIGLGQAPRGPLSPVLLGRL